jgi:hypothetical protein
LGVLPLAHQQRPLFGQVDRLIERPELAVKVESRMSLAHSAVGRDLVNSGHPDDLRPFLPSELTTRRDADTGRISAHATLSGRSKDRRNQAAPA